MQNTALITGASSGIGREFAHIHAEKGGDLVIVARDADNLNALKIELESQYNIQVMVITKDLTHSNAAVEIYAEVKQAGIQVDYLINNAGVGGQGKFHEREWRQEANMIQLNVVTLTRLCHLFLPDFIARNGGKILNVSSTASFMPGPLQAVYYATKAYVTFFSNAIAEELSDTNITVTTLMPGATNTGFAKASGLEKTELFKQTASARSVAEDGYAGMLAGKLDVISGLTFSQKLTMALLPFIPKKMLLKQVYNIQKTA